MKYKILTIFITLFLVIGSIYISSLYHKDFSYVYHQHLEDNSNEDDCSKDEAGCSHLPIVNINTNNQVIPGADGEKDAYIIADVLIYDGKDEVTRLGVDGVSKKAQIRYRGRTSLKFDKKGYQVKFVDSENKKVNFNFLGMPSDNSWVLHGPFIDKSLMRNYMWYNIAQEIMGEAPKTRFLELYVDNEYQGLYLGVEAVTQSKKSRVKMSPIHKNSIATSYLLQLDSEQGNSLTSINTFSKYAYKIYDPIFLTIKYPNEDQLTEEVRKYIYDDFNNFEKTLYSFDYKEYKKYIDVDSFIDYFIINEFTQNYDAGYLSTYMYKDIFGKYKMYIWDFNAANNNYEADLLNEGEQHFEFSKNPWYEMLIKNPEFTDAIIKRYKELRNSYLSEEYLFNYIDGTVNYLGKAIDRNYSVWGYTLADDYSSFKTNYMPNSYEDAINQLKDAIHKRGEWMDKNIDVLRFYSHESKNKKFNK